ncbi:MAG: hydrogenase iron-sulfur subunit, partial [Firmicutes bacterium]|nr:hydrogenase iron-sulfur subunit [Bacillota bacterium]
LRDEPFDRTLLEEPVPLEKLQTDVADKVTRVDRNAIPMIDPAERIKHCKQAELGYDTVTAINEARRCLTCLAGAERIEELCVNCLTCVRVCPYDVPIVNVDGTVTIRSEQCQACGLCMSICPAYAIQFRTPLIDEAANAIEPAVTGLLEKANSAPAVLAVTCGYGPFALPEVTGYQAANLAIVRYPCVGKVDTLHLLKAVEMGVDGIVVLGCKEEAQETCPHKDTIVWIKKRIDYLNTLLEEMGLGDARIAYRELSYADVDNFGQILEEAAEQFKELTPSPLR